MIRTFVRTHTEITFANPFLICDVCKHKVTGYHDGNKCGCKEQFYTVPCEHTQNITSECPSWSPVDGCTCEGGH